MAPARAQWNGALACWEQSEAEMAGLAHSEDEAAYDAAGERHDAALARLLRAAAPDGEAAAWKLGLIDEHRVFELDCWEAAVAVLAEDVRRLAGPSRRRPSTTLRPGFERLTASSG